jgi:hypothetical protein
VNGQVHNPGQQGFLDLFRKDTFAANLRERRVKDGIPRRFDDLNGYTTGRNRPFELRFDPLGLSERQGTAA